MPRLLVHVEGETEEEFEALLRDHLLTFGYENVGARILGGAQQRVRRGGIRPWEPVKGDILRHLTRDSGAIATLLVDFYGLPREWPGRATASAKQGASRKAELVEAALLVDFTQSAGSRFNPRRFVPFVTMHEFEALLFSDPEKFCNVIGRPDLTRSFEAIRQQFETPEDINDSRHTSPSKRILEIYPQYMKPIVGVLASLDIGLATIRRECPHFHDWLKRLEALPAQLLDSDA